MRPSRRVTLCTAAKKRSSGGSDRTNAAAAIVRTRSSDRTNAQQRSYERSSSDRTNAQQRSYERSSSDRGERLSVVRVSRGDSLSEERAVTGVVCGVLATVLVAVSAFCLVYWKHHLAQKLQQQQQQQQQLSDGALEAQGVGADDHVGGEEEGGEARALTPGGDPRGEGGGDPPPPPGGAETPTGTNRCLSNLRTRRVRARWPCAMGPRACARCSRTSPRPPPVPTAACTTEAPTTTTTLSTSWAGRPPQAIGRRADARSAPASARTPAAVAARTPRGPWGWGGIGVSTELPPGGQEVPAGASQRNTRNLLPPAVTCLQAPVMTPYTRVT
ncbi:uncharacterized protein LOC133361001 [Lethenteron reissneri]|uniref:uncharacterized protein LOC133361001 n=1 Tax=Lethenteron reissneri TaxID=7753 RepID=UPI002AB67CC2|nr:uncharacterized protein LOC133361001 [Lethenteron reissneri]